MSERPRGGIWDDAYYIGEIVRVGRWRKGRLMAFSDSRFGTLATVAVGRRGALCGVLACDLRKVRPNDG